MLMSSVRKYSYVLEGAGYVLNRVRGVNHGGSEQDSDSLRGLVPPKRPNVHIRQS